MNRPLPRLDVCRIRTGLCCALLFVLSAGLSFDDRANATPPVGAHTEGGAVPYGRIYHVTSLADSGPGSLREGIQGSPGVVIVFDVAGTIELASELKLHNPHVTIAGQTAPDPGITIHGTVRIRTHDVIIQHIAVRPGPGANAKEDSNRDGISLDGKPGDAVDHASRNILLENVSISWSTDELVSLWYPTTGQVTIRDSILAQALNNARHPKGAHAMGLLIGTGVQGVELTGNLLAANRFRNPAISEGASVFMANNFVFNGGQNFVQTYPRDINADTSIAIIGNIFQAGPDTKNRIKAVSIPAMSAPPSVDRVFLHDNWFDIGPLGTISLIAPSVVLTDKPPLKSSYTVQPVGKVWTGILAHAGARPAHRDRIDQAILSGVAARTLRIIDADKVPPLPSATGTRAWAEPTHPFALERGGTITIASALCRDHLAAGGRPSPSCPD